MLHSMRVLRKVTSWRASKTTYMSFAFNKFDYAVDSDVGTGDISLSYVFGHAHVRSHMSPGMDWLLHCGISLSIVLISLVL